MKLTVPRLLLFILGLLVLIYAESGCAAKKPAKPRVIELRWSATKAGGCDATKVCHVTSTGVAADGHTVWYCEGVHK